MDALDLDQVIDRRGIGDNGHLEVRSTAARSSSKSVRSYLR
jgi:hypothetical protein